MPMGSAGFIISHDFWHYVTARLLGRHFATAILLRLTCFDGMILGFDIEYCMETGDIVSR